MLKVLVELADTLSSAEFHEFDSKFKSVCPFLSHALIVYIFDLFRQFVKLAQNPHVIRGVKASNIIPLEYIETALLMHVDLLHQLKLCVATGSVKHLFATAPLPSQPSTQDWRGELFSFIFPFPFSFLFKSLVNLTLSVLDLSMQGMEVVVTGFARIIIGMKGVMVEI